MRIERIARKKVSYQPFTRSESTTPTPRDLSMKRTALLFVMLVAACAHPNTSMSPGAGSSRVDADLDRLRAATRAYKSLDSAVAVGYPRDVPDCLVHEHHGAMGYHHVNRTYLTPTLNIDHPQILLYERKPDGEYHLNGVEFIIPYRLYARDSV